jgi:putative endopeptidase
MHTHTHTHTHTHLFDSQVNRLTTDPHGPCDFRANLVANMGEFHEVFGVKPNDGMWLSPEDRLRMW